LFLSLIGELDLPPRGWLEPHLFLFASLPKAFARFFFFFLLLIPERDLNELLLDAADPFPRGLPFF